MRILLLNPPSKKKHLRGNYCSNISKGIYYYPAIDLLAQSGILSKDFEIHVCDAIAENLHEAEVIGIIERGGYEGIYAVTGSSSQSEDLEFFSHLKKHSPKLSLLITGGYLLKKNNDILAQAPWIDGVLLDWSSDESISFFKGSNCSYKQIALPGKPPEKILNLREKTIHFPLPKHEMFPLKKYHHPNARSHPFSVITHSVGCPHNCDYCIYGIIPYRSRFIKDVIEELSHLNSLGVREVFFQDPTFAANISEGLTLCNAIIDAKLKMNWFCQTRTDHMNKEILITMHKAGCHAIMFGIESAEETMLKDHKRKTSLRQTEYIYSICRKLGIRTLSYLIIGLPGDTEKTIAATVNFVKKINSDFVSFNLAIPVLGTELRDNAVSLGFINDDLIEFDNSSDEPIMPTLNLTRDQLAKIHRNSVKNFYLRPGYILKRLISIRSFYELRNHFLEGFSLMKRLVRLKK